MPTLLALVRRVLPRRLRASIRAWRDKRGAPAAAAQQVSSAPESVATARAASKAKDWPEAIIRWRRLLAQQGPDAPPMAYEQLAHALRRIRDLESAASTLRGGLERHPGHPALLTQRARLASQYNDWGLAVERWQEVHAAHGDTAPPVVYEQLCRAHRRTGELEAARHVLEEGLARHPAELRLRMEWARLAMTGGDWAQAVKRWRQLVEDERGCPAEVFIHLSVAQRRLGHLDAAEETLADGRHLYPQDVDLAAEQAKLAMEAGDWGVAIARWKAVSDLGAGGPPPEVLRRIARCHIHQGNFEEAAATVETGLRAHPTDPGLAVERVAVAIHASDWGEGRRVWHELLATHSEQVPAAGFARLARECSGVHAHDLADEVAEEGMRRHPDSARLQRQYVHNVLSRERAQGAPSAWDWRDGLARARAVLEQRGTRATVDDHFNLAYELSESAAVHEAIDLLDDAIGRFPTAVRLLDEQATLLSATGEWRRVIDRLDALDALVDVPGRAAVRLRRSRAQRCLGDLENARAALADARGTGLDHLRAELEEAHLTTMTSDPDCVARSWEKIIERYREAAPLEAHRQLAIAHLRAGNPHRSAECVELAREYGHQLERNPGVVAIVGGGPSLRNVDLTPLSGVTHTVAVNATAIALPWSDVAVTHDTSHLAERFRDYPGPVIAGVPLEHLRRMGRVDSIEHRRRLVTDRLSEMDGLLHIGGHTSAYTALNYAYLLRPRLIVLFGIDLQNTDFWEPAEYWHQTVDEYNRRQFQALRHRAGFEAYQEYRARKIESAPEVFASVLPQIEHAGIEVLNASPVSSIECFPKLEPQAAIERCLETTPGR